MLIPLAAGRSGLNGNTAFLFLVHEIGCRRAIMHFTDLVDFTGKLEDTLGRGGFTGINMGKNADIPILFQVSHRGFQFKKQKIRRKQACPTTTTYQSTRLYSI